MVQITTVSQRWGVNLLFLLTRVREHNFHGTPYLEKGQMLAWLLLPGLVCQAANFW
jgi:hypothetical protein